MTHWTEETYLESPEVIGANLHRNVDCAAAETDDLLALLGDHGIDPENALDVACGIGRHAVPLAESGVRVRGVDLSPEYVETARRRAAAADVADRTSFEVGDMREVDGLDGAHDLVVTWLAFGHFDDRTNEQVAAGLRERVSDDGALVLCVPNKDAVVATRGDDSVSRENGLLKVSRSEYTPETGRLETEITMFRERGDDYETVGEAVCDVRLYAPAELSRLLERAGFSRVHLYGGPHGADLAADADRLVAVAEP